MPLMPHNYTHCEICGTKAERIYKCVKCPATVAIKGIWEWSGQGQTHFIQPNDNRVLNKIQRHVRLNPEHAFVPAEPE